MRGSPSPTTPARWVNKCTGRAWVVRTLLGQLLETTLFVGSAILFWAYVTCPKPEDRHRQRRPWLRKSKYAIARFFAGGTGRIREENGHWPCLDARGVLFVVLGFWMVVSLVAPGADTT